MEMELDYDVYKDEIIVIRFDSEMLKGFTGFDKDNPDEYFKLHPRSKKPPMDWLGKTRNGMLPSWNRFINCPNRIVQNQWKQDLGKYTDYCILVQNVPRAYLSKCIIVAIQHKPTRGKRDNDNIFLKASFDSLTKNEVLQDDNDNIVRFMGNHTVYDKQDPHTEVRIYPIIEGVYDFDYVMDIMNCDIKELEAKYSEG